MREKLERTRERERAIQTMKGKAITLSTHNDDWPKKLFVTTITINSKKSNRFDGLCRDFETW